MFSRQSGSAAADRRRKPEIGEDVAWRFLLELRALSRGTPYSAETREFGFDGRTLRPDVAGTVLTLECDEHEWRWHSARPVSAGAELLLELFLPICAGISRGGPYVVGHLGQSLDGRIATETGVSKYVTGPENIRHMHRLRALADAVVVGAGTVAYDDPRLTTREVDGPNPARVIIDPDGRLPAERQVFNDGEAATLLVCSPQRVVSYGLAAENCLSVPMDDDGRISVRGIVDALGSRGFRLIFVEGGGVTVSRFLEAGALDRLQLTVAPILLGSGRAAVTLPPIGTLEEALRPAVRQFVMGRDLLYDCDLRAEATD